MRPLTDIAKAAVITLLPQAIVNRLKKFHYLRKVRHVSASDEADLEIVKALVREGDHVVDLGANIGVYTVFLSHLVSETGRVYSFEPMPVTFGFLDFNVRALGLTNVILRQAAITDHACTVEMAVPSDASGLENFYQACVVRNGSQALPGRTTLVRGSSLDEAIPAEDQPVTFIKCDVEGHEFHCLKGATRLISRWRPAWLMEVSGDPEQDGSNAAAVFSLMRDWGYRPFFFKDHRVLPWTSSVRSINYLFLQSSQMESLHARGLLTLTCMQRGSETLHLSSRMAPLVR